MKRTILYIILVLSLVLSMTTAGLAQGGLQPVPGALEPDSTYSVEVAKTDRTPAFRAPSVAGFELVSVIVIFDDSFDASALEAVSGGKITHRYQKIFNGASLVVGADKVADVASLPGVTAVYADELLKPDTETSPAFIGAPTVWSALGGQESAGEGVVVGVLDTGIWPEHPSFSDPDPSGKPYDPPAVLPGSNGFGSRGPKDTCDFGDMAWNPNDADFTCNNKLIGAYDFLDTYKALLGLIPDEFDSARDAEGHGTHTSSTAAGNGGVDASVFGVDRGTISGIAPRAHVIMYRVCALDGCYSSDSAAAVEQAILDEVDVINFSISGGNNPFGDAVSEAFLAAYDSGVLVAASAGNSGPGAETVGHREPWTITSGASTHDRAFQTTAIVVGSGGATLELTGASLTAGIAAPTEVMVAPDPLCLGPYVAGQFTNKVVVCMRGTTGRAEKGFTVLQGDAAGMILYNQAPEVTDLETDNHFLPTVHIQFSQGQDLLAFLTANPGATATWSAGVATTVQGDVMASFSSRGGPGQTLGISKPDITAPGVQILAGHTPMTADVAGGPDGELFQAIAGTSMSSPHTAGSAALIKALHPDWTPGQIKSALMTTAFADVVKEDGVTPANAFDFGSGRVDLNKAGNPGLTFDASATEYVAHEDDLWNANYPSLYVPVMPGLFTVWRTVHSVAPRTLGWKVTVDSPPDVKIKVIDKFKLKPGEDKTFAIMIEAGKVPLGEVRFATIYFTSKNIKLRFPVTIVRRQPIITMDKTCAPSDLAYNETTTCTINITNTSSSEASVQMFDYLPAGFNLVPGSVSGAEELNGGRTLRFVGNLFGALPPVVMVEQVGVDTLPGGGYLPLSLFGTTPIAGVGDETIVNFTVPEFMYAGEAYTRIGMVSNGYLVVGGGTGADVEYINQNLPNSIPPNNVLAPFWTDLNPAFGGAMRVEILTDGVNDWVIFEWEDVANYGDRAPNDFQVWIGVNGVEDITFAYGDVTLGDAGNLTVGAENAFGTSGQNLYYNGTGTAPAADVGVNVFSEPAAPGETHTVTFQLVAKRTGKWGNCAQMTSNLFQGTNIACSTGIVAKARK
jgi:uncharacterized repeat protein (TIGR01451 family)